jgi:hypothetical protein
MGPTNRVVTLKLIRYSLLMLLAPLATFYFCFYVVFKQDKDMLGWSGIFAVIAANMVIVSYVVMAFGEKDEEDEVVAARKEAAARSRGPAVEQRRKEQHGKVD